MDDVEQVGSVGELSRRLAALEAAVEAMEREVRTERLIVAGPDRRAWIELVAHPQWAELKIGAREGRGGHRVELCAFVGADDPAKPAGLSADVGVWADGDQVAGLALPSFEASGGWRPRLYIDDGDAGAGGC